MQETTTVLKAKQDEAQKKPTHKRSNAYLASFSGPKNKLTPVQEGLVEKLWDYVRVLKFQGGQFVPGSIADYTDNVGLKEMVEVVIRHKAAHGLILEPES